jgi:hypothetical protein
MGVLLISAGVGLISRTPPHTADEPAKTQAEKIQC